MKGLDRCAEGGVQRLAANLFCAHSVSLIDDPDQGSREETHAYYNGCTLLLFILFTLLAHKASEASWGLSYFCQGVLRGYCCVCVDGYCCVWGRMCHLGVFRKVANSRAVVTLFGGEWLLWFLMMFHYKSIVSHHMNIVMFINGVCYRGSSLMSQIHVQ